MRAWSLLTVVAIGALCSRCGGPCVQEGGEYSEHELYTHCCAGLENVNIMFEPGDDYEGDGLPEGCTTNGAPPDMMVCLPCGDGSWGAGEHFCNCPEDCAAPAAL